MSVKIESLETRQMLTAAVSNTEVLANITGKNGLSTVAAYLKTNPKATLNGYIDLKHSKQLFTDGKTSLVQIRLAKGITANSTIKLLAKVTGTKWASPNYVYGRAKGDAVPTDPRYPSQVDPLKQIELEKAWDVTTGSPNVVVAVLDDGFDATHEDLQGVAWTNAGEIPGNNKDDDNNGYVDDVNGWDFGGNDNNTQPAYDTTYGFYDSHGTQVASTIGAVRNNAKGIAGVAGVKIMPVRFRGADVVVTSAGIASSVAYAANNGAKIINLSFSFDPYMNDPAFGTAVDLAYTKGVLWLNSSGNSNVVNPPRTLVDKILFVNNVDANDVRNSTSNFGSATDISAPGTEIVTASPVNSYYPSTGTSFSTAVTSGIAALIWSAHPTWTRDQVAAQLLGTVDNIDAKNPTFISQLGTGRVNAFKAVSGTLAAPTFRGLSGIANNGTLSTPPGSLSLGTFSVLDASTVTASAFELRGAGADNTFNTADDMIVATTIANTYAYGTNKIDFNLAAPLVSGQYRFTAKTTIADPFGTKLAAPFVTTFSVTPQAAAAPTNLTAAIPSYSKTEAELSWTDTTNNETSFVIERSSVSTFATIDKTMTASANSTRYNDWGLEQGKTYYYRIRAMNAAGPGNNSATATLVIPAPPAGVPTAPSNLVAAAGGSATEIALSWKDNSTNATSFTIQRSTSSTFATIDKTLTAIGGSNMYWDWGLTAGTTYYYCIQAVNGTDLSAWSNTVGYKAGTGVVTVPTNPTTPPVTPPVVTVPAAPTTFAATAAAGGKATLTWKDNSTNETGFIIERSLLSSFALLTTSKTVAANTTTLAETGLTAGLTYYYRIRSTNTAGSSAWSTVISIKAK